MNTQQLQALLALIDDTPTGSSARLPDRVFVRTVTMHHIGQVISIDPDWLVLDLCSWVADSGRFHEALETGTLDEVERFPDRVWINRGSIVDLTAWNHDLPNTSK